MLPSWTVPVKVILDLHPVIRHIRHPPGPVSQPGRITRFVCLRPTGGRSCSRGTRLSSRHPEGLCPAREAPAWPLSDSLCHTSWSLDLVRDPLKPLPGAPTAPPAPTQHLEGEGTACLLDILPGPSSDLPSLGGPLP